jgi:hypothetical protein
VKVNKNKFTHYFQCVKLKCQDDEYGLKFRNVNISSLGGTPKLPNISSYSATGTDFQLFNGILRIPTPSLKLLFEPSLHKIATHIEYLLGLAECSSVRHLFLVGGFAESSLLRNAINNKIGSKVKVVTPPRPGCSVVTGAVFMELILKLLQIEFKCALLDCLLQISGLRSSTKEKYGLWLMKGSIAMKFLSILLQLESSCLNQKSSTRSIHCIQLKVQFLLMCSPVASDILHLPGEKDWPFGTVFSRYENAK